MRRTAISTCLGLCLLLPVLSGASPSPQPSVAQIDLYRMYGWPIFSPVMTLQQAEASLRRNGNDYVLTAPDASRQRSLRFAFRDWALTLRFDAHDRLLWLESLSPRLTQFQAEELIAYQARLYGPPLRKGPLTGQSRRSTSYYWQRRLGNLGGEARYDLIEDRPGKYWQVLEHIDAWR